jgi:hypothetical protein
MNMDLFSENATVVLVHGAWADGSSWKRVIVPLLHHPDETVSVGLQLRSLRMRFFAVEYLSYCLTFVGSESSNVHQRSHLLVCRRCDYGTSVRVPSE